MTAPDAPGVAPVRRTGTALITKLQHAPTQIAEALLEAQQNGKDRKAFERYLRGCAELLFSYWAAQYDHPQAILDDDREKLLLRRLRENQGDVSELLYTIDGGLRDELVNGTGNGIHHKNDGVGFIFRTRERVEQLAERCGRYRRGERHKMAVKYVDAQLNGNGAHP